MLTFVEVSYPLRQVVDDENKPTVLTVGTP
jgi:hypothetical protein